MSYTADSGRRQIIDDAVVAANALGDALAALGEAYELLEEHEADRMEDTVFKPTQAAYGQLKRTLTEFAERYGLTGPNFRNSAVPAPTDPQTTLDRVSDQVQGAEDALAELQDTLLPVEVGDPELRAGLARTRTLVGPVPAAAGELMRNLGR
ncbi:MAG: hypothetical protein J2O48_02940 [Solirubrobacterales bacterium]|nr:hypothetical protein [Solirubrobacterales bacterium]